MDYIKYYLSGFLMGVADVVPGVSGGTIAFILGIYKKLLSSISYCVSPKFFKFLFKLDFKNSIFSKQVIFLITLVGGMGTSILALSGIIKNALELYPEYVWSLFFGLVLASIPFLLFTVKQLKFRYIFIFFTFAILSFIFFGLSKIQFPEGNLYNFLAGALASTAMILPGISGSFILVIIGKYDVVLEALHSRDLAFLSIFITGAVVGVLSFSKILHYLLKKYYGTVIYILAGLVAGALRVIYPFKKTINKEQWSVDAATDAINAEVLEITLNYLPTQLSKEVIISLCLMVLGFIIVFLLNIFGSTKKDIRFI